MLKPEDVLPLNEQQQKLYRAFEDTIDSALIKNPYGVAFHTFSSPSHNELVNSGVVWKKLRKEYEKNGWTFIFDPPDSQAGDSINGGILRMAPKDL